MMESNDDALEAARSIRPALPRLYPSGSWQALDAQLADLLNGGDDPEETARAVEELLGGRPETADWWLAFQATGLPPEVDATRGGWTAVGAGEVVGAPRFACPHGDFVWYRRSAARPIPVCRTHDLRLTPAPRSRA